MAATSKYGYAGRSRESVETVANRRISSYDSFFDTSIKLFKPRLGGNALRFLPSTWGPKMGDDHFGYSVFVHRDIGVDHGTYLCSMKTQDPETHKEMNQRCPICEGRDQLQADRAKKEILDGLKPREVVLAYVIDRNAESEGPQIWTMSLRTNQEFAGRMVNKRTKEAILIDDPENGYDVEFRREGERLKTKYSVFEISREMTYLCDDEKVQDAWIKFIKDHPIPEILMFHEYDYIARVFAGHNPESVLEEDEEQQQDDSPRTRRRLRDEEAPAETPPRNRQRMTQPEPEPEEPEPAPRQSRRSRTTTEQPKEEEVPESVAAGAASLNRLRRSRREE